MSELGSLVKIDDFRTIWKNERSDFSTWLSKEENLSLLGSEIGIDLVLDERESSVGSFSADLFCHDEGTSRKIIIENQLEDTNHDHLGKIITYAAGKSADVLIWIVRHARDEHKQAVEWLNEHTDDDIGIFLIEIELWKIDESRPVPHFNVVERPNDWAKSIKAAANLTNTKKLQQQFWLGFNEFAKTSPEFSKEFTIRKANPQHWYYLAAGSSSYKISLTINTQNNALACGIYIDENKDLFQTFESHKAEIEESVGEELDWQLLPDKKASRIELTRPGNIKKEANWNEYFAWFCDISVKLKKSVAGLKE